MKTGYFPGCSLHSTGREYAESVAAIAHELELELEEVNDWACCGASSAHATNHLLSIALPARTLGLAAEQELDRVLAPCAACYSRLAAAERAVRDDAALRGRVEEVLGRRLGRDVHALSILAWLSEQVEAIERKRTVTLGELRVACYYGCLLVRPTASAGRDDPEQPTSMERIVRSTGATPVAWNMALECCGAGMSLARLGSVVRLGRAIVEDARAHGAQAIVVGCPMCHSNLDFRQRAMTERGHESDELPVLYLSQLVGLALGIEPRPLGLHRHFVAPSTVLSVATGTKSLPAAEASSG
jgi:heterodisulfide reductase subunit B